MFGCALSLLLVLGSLGLGMVAFRLSMRFIVALYLLLCGHLAVQEGWSRSRMLITLRVSLGSLVCSCVQVSSLHAVFG